MAARHSRFFRAVHITGDVFLLNLAFFLCNAIYYDSLSIPFNDHYIKQYLYINLFWGISASLNRVYDLYRVVKFETVFTTLLRTFLLHLLLCFAFIVFFKEYVVSYRLFAIKYTTFVILLCTWRISFLYTLKLVRMQGLNFRNVIILGSGPVAREVHNFFVRHPEHGYRFLGFFASQNTKPEARPEDVATYDTSIVKTFVLENNVDEIYCSLADIDHNLIKELMLFSDANLIRFKLLPDFRGMLGKKLVINFYDHIPVLMARKEPLDNLVNRMLKRVFDILFSLAVLILLFPWLIPLIAIAIKLTSKGPVFFKQWRSGLNNYPFLCYKFRSMYSGVGNPNVQATRRDPRITAIGRFLRKTSLDELPQFFNVFVGNMSIVGPRPHMIQHTEKYSKLISTFMVRHFVKPGITGLAQISGYRGETTDPVLMQKRVEHDIWYIENWSFFLDLKIIFLTVFNVLRGDRNAV
jgi:putative colanic acid biosysnthesis UDP-glucose lipid carrier transferase